MRPILSLFLFISSFTVSLGQTQLAKPPITVFSFLEKENTSSWHGLNSITKSILSENYYFTQESPLQLKVVAIPGKATSISGIDNYTIRVVELIYTISFQGANAQSKSISIKCKGSSEHDLLSTIGKNISRSKAIQSEVLAFIEEYVSSMITSCSEVSALIEEQLVNGDPESAYESLAYYNLVEGCQDITQEKENRILYSITAATCKELINEAEILANGATIKDLSKATEKLLLVPNDSPCKEDVIRISQLVSFNAKELGTQSGDEINIKLHQRQSRSRADWHKYYRDKYYHRN